ncbi:phosphotransferase family protein [Mycolicibacterium stellerae]|uniref:phosphotransferase family protein n=1 Tax=Mycolicibacterium stellerae TaxID=2358193 RepID=UPI0013DE25E3|nr:phosphotransferase family protein [Mycolicibacterium stellerae]
MKAISAGHSNETYLVEGLDEILRMPPSVEGMLPPYDMAAQHSVLAAVKANTTSVPVPEVFEVCTDPEVLGDPFFLMERLPGESFEYAVPEWLATDPVELPDKLCRQWFDALIGLHNMPATQMPAVHRSLQQEAQHWLEVAQSAEGPEALIDVLSDLAARPPATSGPPTPVHGDPKQGNCLWHEGKLTALLDWEMAHVSEPMLDLGYLLMFHDQGEASMANSGHELPGWWSAERMVAEWEAGTGRTAVDVARYTALGNAKAGAIIAKGAHLYTSCRTSDARFAKFVEVLPIFTDLVVRRAMAAG